MVIFSRITVVIDGKVAWLAGAVDIATGFLHSVPRSPESDNGTNITDSCSGPMCMSM